MKQLKYIIVSLLLFTLACKEDIEYIDGMIGSLTEGEKIELAEIKGLQWKSALPALFENRQNVSNLLLRIERGAYTQEGYDIENPEALKVEITQLRDQIDHCIDSIWKVEVKDSFEFIDAASQGIVSLGNMQYAATTDQYTSMYNWLKSDYKTDTNMYVTNDFDLIQNDISVLKSLSLLDANDVIAYIDDIKSRFNEVDNSYPTLADQVNISEYISLAQKELYASLSDNISALELDMNGNITLSTSDQLANIESDLMSLTYFFDNNNTSPAIKPLVYGQIRNICELRWFSEEATADDYAQDWLLMADIDASETHRWNLDADGAGFQPIKEFTGNFDGGYHMISGMLLTAWGAFDQCRPGMFHYYLGGTMQNLGLVNLFVNNTSTATGQGGTLIAYLGGKTAVGGHVERCFVQGVKELGAQDGAFIGRIRGAVVMKDCFSVVDCNTNGEAGNKGASSSFFGHVITGPHTLKNLINLGQSKNNVFTGGLSSANIAEALGLYFDASAVGQTRIESGSYATTTVTLSDNGVVTDLPTEQWGGLSSFESFSSDVWEVNTISLFDESPRPYLKGFNYEGIDDFIVPDISVYE